MNFIVEITDDKFSELTENAEKMLRYGGKVMSCLDSIKRERFNERSPMPDYRSSDYRNRDQYHPRPDYREREDFSGDRRQRDRRDYDNDY